MSHPNITSLQPIVLDHRRITLDLVVANLPTLIPNVTLTMPTGTPNEYRPSVYPNLSLTIWDSSPREVAGIFIVEHQEEHVALTLHLRGAEAVSPLVARAEMLHGDEVIQVVEVPFTLQESAN